VTRLELTQVLGQILFQLHVDITRFDLVFANLLASGQSLLFSSKTSSCTGSCCFLLGSQFGSYCLVD
jgi:hypothetical protein